MLRKHQRIMMETGDLIRSGVSTHKNILALVTPGGGKSAIPAILSKTIAEPLNYKICWVVPRDALRRQGEESFVDPFLRSIIGHKSEIRAAGNDIDPSRGTIGYITTYQALVAQPDHHRQVFEHARYSGTPYILILDEGHHVPAPEETDADIEERAYYSAIAPLFELAEIKVVMTGTDERHDGKRIAFLPYTQKAGPSWVNLDSPEDWHVIRYSRRDGLEEGAICPLHMYYGDSNAIWEDQDGQEISVESIAEMEKKYQSAALKTVLQTNYAYALIDKCLDSWQSYKRGVYSKSKMLIIAPDRSVAKDYARYIRSLGHTCEIAISDHDEAAPAAIKRFKRNSDILVSVAIAYEGLDVKQITHVALMTKYRSRPWIEQAISRANRSDDGKTHGFIYSPDDPSLREILTKIESEQQGVVLPVNFGKRRESSRESADLSRPYILPLASDFTRGRGYGLDDGTTTEWGEDEQIERAMKEAGIIASTVAFKQAMRSLGLANLSFANGEVNKPVTALPPISEREKIVRKNIQKHISLHAQQHAPDRDKRIELITHIRKHAASLYGPIDNLNYNRLRDQYDWLQRVYPLAEGVNG